MPFDFAAYGGLIFILSVFMAIFLALTYMAAKFFHSNELEAYFHIELQEIFMSFLILFFAIAFIESSTLVSQSIVGGDGDAITAALGFINDIRIGTKDAINNVFAAQICLSIQSTLHRRIGEYVLTTSFKLFPGVDSMVSVFNVVGYGLTTVYSSLGAQSIILIMISSFAIPFLLPAGILLRFFPPTRQAGIFLIAAAIGFQVIFPLTYVLNMKVFQDTNLGFPNPDEIYHSGVLGNWQTLCYGQWFFFGALGNDKFLFGLGNIPVLNPVVRALFSEFGINALSTPFLFSSLLESVAILSLPTLFLPALSTTITIAFINSFMKFLSVK